MIYFCIDRFIALHQKKITLIDHLVVTHIIIAHVFSSSCNVFASLGDSEGILMLRGCKQEEKAHEW